MTDDWLFGVMRVLYHPAVPSGGGSGTFQQGRHVSRDEPAHVALDFKSTVLSRRY